MRRTHKRNRSASVAGLFASTLRTASCRRDDPAITMLQSSRHSTKTFGSMMRVLNSLLSWTHSAASEVTSALQKCNEWVIQMKEELS